MPTCVCCPIVPWWWGWGGLECFWVVFVLPLSVPGGQLLPAAVVERVLVPCGHDGELSRKFGNWPVLTEERGRDAKYSITRGILAFVRMSCPIRTGAPRMQFHTWFLHLSGVQVQSNLTSRCLTHTRAHRHTQAHAHAAVLQSNSSSVVLSSICFFLDPDDPGVGLAAVPSL